MSQNWRTEVDAQDYLGNQKKKLEVADRRPVIRKASDLVGPGIGSSATRVTDYNDLLATYDGYYASAPGASNAPNSTDAFVGYVIMDSLLGGKQVFTSLATEEEFSRIFIRGTSDPSSITWGDWTSAASTANIPPSLATNGSLVNTATPVSTPTILTTPSTYDTSGDITGVYSRSSTQFNILKAGVYTGLIRLGAADADVNLDIQYPQGAVQLTDTYFSPDLTSVVSFPLTFMTTVTTGFVRATMTRNSGSGNGRYYKFAITRVGDV